MKSKKKNSHNLKTLILFCATLLLIFTWIGVRYLSIQKKQNNSGFASTSTTDVLLNTDSWQVSADPLERYYLKHPPTWKTETDVGSYPLSLINSANGHTIRLVEISSASKEEVLSELLKAQRNTDKRSKYIFEEKVLGQNTVFLAKRVSADPATPTTEYSTAFVLNDSHVAQFEEVGHYADTEAIQTINTIYSTFKYDGSLDGKSVFYQSEELKVHFSYPSELGRTYIEPPQRKKGLQNEKEEWWRVGFGKNGFEPGYYQVSASTPNYVPEFWEGMPHWFNSKVAVDETEESVKQKLTAAKWQVIKVNKVASPNNVVGFKVWSINCYSACTLSRVYVVPVANSKYNNLLIFTYVSLLNDWRNSITTKEAQSLALSEIQKIEKNQAEVSVQKYIDGQDLIFNTLTLQ